MAKINFTVTLNGKKWKCIVKPLGRETDGLCVYKTHRIYIDPRKKDDPITWAHEFIHAGLPFLDEPHTHNVSSELIAAIRKASKKMGGFK